MNGITDDALVEELKLRFQENQKTLHDLKIVTKKLEGLNKKLQASEALKSNFLSNIRNEIDNPLASIMGFSEHLLAAEQPNSETIRAIAENIHSEAFILDFQLKNIFVAAELEAGEAVLIISNVDIGKIIHSMIDSLKYLSNEKQLTVDFSNEIVTDFSFKTDAEKFHLALLNLLKNAIEYSHKENRVEIKASINKGCLSVSVQDFGIGMNKSDLTVIFDRFTQLDTGSTKSHGGHGLGLSVTRALLELLNGTVSVRTDKKEGSTFTLSIPEAETVLEVDAFSSDSNELFFSDAEEY